MTLRLVRCSLLLSCVLTCAGPALADDLGYAGAIRVGMAYPLGKLVASPRGDLAENVNGQVSFALDAGLRVERWVLGLYAGVGFGGLADQQNALFASAQLERTSAFSATIGPEVHYYFGDDDTLRPWFGVLSGYEVLGVTAEGGGHRRKLRFSGWQLLRPMLGVDVQFTRRFGAGFYTDFSIAQFGSYSLDASGDPTATFAKDVTIVNPAYHYWWTFGVRITLTSPRPTRSVSTP